MSNIAIGVEGLGKKYRLGANAQPYKTIRESVTGLAGMPLRAASRLARRSVAEGGRGHRPEFWALKDVSFEVKHGEVLGIIGRNGAGKSTLLKLLSQITEPTEGRIGINGRVASLLEVGTGFHPELTGRENVYLNGAILGMSRQEVASKFDEIVAFAEVEKFVDTQVKYYSSGMYLRLAFAVAAHLEPEILIVDEVLAVGDASFQKKCLGKMEDVSREGRTVLFVSHNMAAVNTLCDSGIVMERGAIACRGRVTDALAFYAQHISGQLERSADLRTWEGRSGTGDARIVWGNVAWEGLSAQLDFMAMGDNLVAHFDVECGKDIQSSELLCACVVSTITGIPVLHVTSADEAFLPTATDRMSITVRLPNLSLFPGVYVISLWVGNKGGEGYDYVKDCLKLEVVKSSTILRTLPMNWDNGLVYHQSHWSSESPSRNVIDFRARELSARVGLGT
jgi:lipopolysaccharide transport system ATP-binding protein